MFKDILNPSDIEEMKDEAMNKGYARPRHVPGANFLVAAVKDMETKEINFFKIFPEKFQEFISLYPIIKSH